MITISFIEVLVPLIIDVLLTICAFWAIDFNVARFSLLPNYLGKTVKQPFHKDLAMYEWFLLDLIF